MNVNYYTDTLGQSGQRDMTKYTIALFSQLWQRETSSYKQASVEMNGNSPAVHSDLAGNPRKQARAFVVRLPIYLHAVYTNRSNMM